MAMGHMTTLLDETGVFTDETSQPTVWGLRPVMLHEHFWASRGVQVVRTSSPSEIDRKAELFLLLPTDKLVLFDLRNWIGLFQWTKPDLLWLRLHARKNLGYREVLVANEDGDFQRFERRYKATQILSTRVGLTCDRELAEAWSGADSAGQGSRQLRAAIPAAFRETRSARGRVYRRSNSAEVGQFVEDLVGIWTYPGATIPRAKRLSGGTWMDADARVGKRSRIVGPIWVGAGRELSDQAVVVGPVVLWDDPEVRPSEIETSTAGSRVHVNITVAAKYRAFKRIFDVVFSIVGLLLTLPLYPLFMLLILLEDGGPVFFSHERETLDGRVFRCHKFRTMRNGAEKLTRDLSDQNQADGPQFFMDNDPRITKIGRILRQTHLDELPQFWNVLLGDMSVVGPRPSPRGENQYCAEWREARLSIRPGITGLWQVRRTRLRGRDFQEWIKYDIQYVESMCWTLDLRLMWQTVVVILRRTVRS
jgi:lipopolysaccharide/colanic/teichoic acid biosynthesis glycosyltransferase